MHRSLAACVLAVACASPPRALPSADWAKGTLAMVRVRAVAEWEQRIRPPLEEDLRTAGFRVVSEALGRGELEVVIGEYDGSHLPFTVEREGEAIDHVRFQADSLPCQAATIAPACVAREVAVRVLESPRVAAAARQTKPQAVAAAKGALAGKLAVLELRNFAKDLSRENVQYFTDVVRAAALKAQPQLEVITRENLLVLLQATGKDLANCEGECEVDTGRRIGADQIVSGEIQRLGSLYKLSLRMHDTRAGRLLGSAQASGKTVEELDESAQKAAADLLSAR